MNDTAPPPFPLPGNTLDRADKARVWHGVDDEAKAFLRDFGTVFGELALGPWTKDGTPL